MGLFSGRDNTADRVAEAQRQALEKSQRQLEQGFGEAGGIVRGGRAQSREDFLRQRGQTEEGFDPFIQAGQGALGELQRGSTAQGLNEILQQITGGETFQALQDLQRRGAEGQLSAAGLGGSGLGVQQLSQIGPQLALQLAGNLRGRQEFLSGQGLEGVGQRGQLGNQLFGQQGQFNFGFTGLEAGLRERLGLAQAGISQGLGGIEGQRIAGDAAARAQRRGALGGFIGSTVGAIGGAVVGGPQGARVGAQAGGRLGRQF